MNQYYLLYHDYMANSNQDITLKYTWKLRTVKFLVGPIN